LRIGEQETRLILHEHDDDDDNDDDEKMLENKAGTMGLFGKAYVHRFFKFSNPLYVFSFL
jgi:hypothetical protein